jgi:hypothetical protein
MGSLEKVRYQHPFGILEVSRVGLLEFGHSSSLPDYLRNTFLGVFVAPACLLKK